jgi:hypothetical protein
MDVINAAKMISECGSKLNKLAKDIAAQVNHPIFHFLIWFFSSSALNHNRNLILLPMLIVSDIALQFLFQFLL